MKTYIYFLFCLLNHLSFCQKDFQYFKEHPDFWPITTSITETSRTEILGVVSEMKAGGPYQLIEVEKLLDFVKVYVPNASDGLKKEYPIDISKTDFLKQANAYLESLSEDQKQITYATLDQYKEKWPDEVMIRRTHKVKLLQKGRGKVAFGDMVKPLSIEKEDLIIEINGRTYVIDPLKTDILSRLRHGDDYMKQAVAIQGNIINTVGATGAAESKLAGTLAEDVVRIPVDEADNYFVGGYCRVRVGNKFGFINKKGDFVLPMDHVFEFNGGFNHDGALSGEVLSLKAEIGKYRSSNGKYGVIDFDGQEVLPALYKDISIYDNGLVKTIRYVKVDQYRTETRTEFFDPHGNSLGDLEKKMTESVKASCLENGIPMHSFKRVYWDDFFKSDLARVDIQTTSQGVRRMAMVNSDGNVVIPPIYYKIHPFSEGLAAAGFVDSFGKVKWGYIKPSNRVAIDFKFQREPYNFSNGLALVLTADPAQVGFNAAFIDTLGNIRLKIQEPVLPINADRNTKDEIVNRDQKFELPTFMINKGKRGITPFMLYEDGTKKQIDYWNLSMPTPSRWAKPFEYNELAVVGWGGVRGIQGVVDSSGNLIIHKMFKKIYGFQKETTLSWAELEKDGRLTKGFIDKEGVFKIILDSGTGGW